MDAEFWHERWENKQIGFHENEVNGLLVAHFDQLGLARDSRVFVPLCGKTLDVGWLLAQGCRVAGIELSRIAVEELFAELGEEPDIRDCGALMKYNAEGIDIFLGDVFALTASELGAVDAVYDRAATVALPEGTRTRYTEHVRKITDCAPQLLICLEYEQQRMAGPPFSVNDSHVQALHSKHYRIKKIAAVDVPGGLKGKCPALEVAWHLTDL